MADTVVDGDDLQPARTRTAKDSRWRIIALLGVVLAIVLGVGVWWYTQWTAAASHRASQVLSPGDNIKGAPGGDNASSRYRELIEKRNEQAALDAKREGTSAIASIVTGVPQDQLPPATAASTPEWTPPAAPTSPVQEPVAQQTVAAPPPPPQHRDPRGQRTQPPPVDQNTLKVANAIISGWNPGGHADFFAAPAETGDSTPIGSTAASGGKAGSTVAAAPNVLMRAGSTAYGSLDLTLNSDVGGPVRATILSGPLKNALLMGSFTLQELGKLLVVQFSVMSMPDGRTVPVKAYLIDPAEALAAMRSSVNNHYLLKVAAPLAAAFLAGFGTPTSTIISNPASTIVGTNDDTSQVDRGLAAVGYVALDILKEAADRPPTVILDAGEGIGILFLNDVTDQPVDGTPVASTFR